MLKAVVKIITLTVMQVRESFKVEQLLIEFKKM